MKDELTASEALYGFVGWLTTRKEKTIMSSSHDCSVLVELITQFCDENSLSEPRERWEKNLIHPSGACSAATPGEN